METDKKYAVYIEISALNKDFKNHIKKICITNNIDKAEAYFNEEGDD